MSLSEVPRPAVVYGFAGVIPFAAGTLGAWLLPPEEAGLALSAQMAYAACILSFMGAVHWGLAMAGVGASDARAAMTWERLGWSVMPALVAWASMLLPALPGLVVLIVTFALLFHGDLLAIRLGLAPPWYRFLRRPLTVLVIVCLGLSLIRLLLASGY
jgi:hypothetical protein